MPNIYHLSPRLSHQHLNIRQARDSQPREQFLSTSVRSTTDLILILSFSRYHNDIDHQSPAPIRVRNSLLGPWVRPAGLSTGSLSIGQIDFTRAILSDYFMYSTSKWGPSKWTKGQRMGLPRGPLGGLCPHKWLPGSAVAHLPLIPTPRLTFASSFLCSPYLPVPLPLSPPRF